MNEKDQAPDELAHVTALVEKGTARYLTLTEAATYARASPRTIRRWVRRGELRRCGPGRHIRIDRDDLVRLLSGEVDEARE